MGEGLILVDAFDGINTWALAHELTHLLDAELCGFVGPDNRDPGFEALNPGDIYRSGKAKAHVAIQHEQYFSEESLFSDNRAASALGHRIEDETVTWSSLVSSPEERVQAKEEHRERTKAGGRPGELLVHARGGGQGNNWELVAGFGCLTEVASQPGRSRRSDCREGDVSRRANHAERTSRRSIPHRRQRLQGLDQRQW